MRPLPVSLYYDGDRHDFRLEDLCMYTCEALQFLSYSLCEACFALLIHIVLLYFPVATFDPDSRFIYNVLSRLEAVMGVKIVSVLAEVCYQLTTASEVQLQPRVNPYGVTTWPDPKTNPCRYVEEVISQWSEGRSARPPTWRELLHVLKDIGELGLGQQIEYFMTGAHQVLNGKEGLFRYL